MRKQLIHDIEANLNLDAATILKDLMQKHNDLVDEYNALLVKMDSDFADVTGASVDYVSTSASVSSINID